MTNKTMPKKIQHYPVDSSLHKDHFQEAINSIRGSYFELDNATINFLINLSTYIETGKGVKELMEDMFDSRDNMY
jgi:hypothetical protein